MNKFLKGLFTTCLVIPCAFSMSGCGKNNEPKMETWDGNVASVSDAVDGIITIDTAEELAGLAKNVNEGTTYKGYTIKLAVDMDLANIEWTPIGFGSANYLGVIDTTSGAYFEGIFDGGNHTIYNLKITSFAKGGQGEATASAGVGFIGFNRGTIKDLTIDTSDVKGNHYVGVLTGFNLNATINNCHIKNGKVNNVYANEDDSGDKAGGIAGHFARGILQDDAASISNCTVTNTTVSADRDAGQVIGCLSNGANQTFNTATQVSVSWNESGNVANKSNTNITNDIVGRIA